MKAKKTIGIEKRQAVAGMLFILPWLAGFIYFFGLSFIESIIYSFSKVSISEKGVITEFIGVENFKSLFYGDVNFVRNLTEAIKNIFIEVPIILFFSIFIALILNQKFRARGIARALFFLPVIIASSVIIQIMKADEQTMGMAASQSAFMFKSYLLRDILVSGGLSPGFVNYFMQIVDGVFDLTWKSGVQILLFLSGLQSIPHTLYEASSIEGATTWEAFWQITFPMISPIILVNIVYSIIDSFTQYGNKVMDSIIAYSRELKYAYSSTMGVIYFACIFLIILIVTRLISKKVFYMAD